ncbi:hypothetical protein SETIT_9G080900v2 [Setaria italica]|uniref:Uncharacterized protein n=1 Tax=Setaria italica TaxID=4555 RepID=A0A368SEA8_SETIT|nr:hypothetical protein SETIT_9G080900v2 [Setaria italica]
MQSQYKNMALSNPAVAELYQIHHMEETRTGRPRVMVAARGEAFFRCEPVSRHGVMGRCEVPRSRARQL